MPAESTLATRHVLCQAFFLIPRKLGFVRNVVPQGAPKTYIEQARLVPRKRLIAYAKVYSIYPAAMILTEINNHYGRKEIATGLILIIYL